MTTSMTAPKRVEYIGNAILGVRKGEQGPVTGMDGKGRLCVDFPSGPELVWPAEVRDVPELVATVVLDNERCAGLLDDGMWDHYLSLTAADREDMALIGAGEYTEAEVCQCDHTGADHCGETVMTVNTHRCVRCECLMYEPARPRFEPTTHDGIPTIRDNQTGMVCRHQGEWSEEFAADVARDLTLTPGPAHLLKWEAA